MPPTSPSFARTLLHRSSWIRDDAVVCPLSKLLRGKAPMHTTASCDLCSPEWPCLSCSPSRHCSVLVHLHLGICQCQIALWPLPPLGDDACVAPGGCCGGGHQQPYEQSRLAGLPGPGVAWGSPCACSWRAPPAAAAGERLALQQAARGPAARAACGGNKPGHHPRGQRTGIAHCPRPAQQPGAHNAQPAMLCLMLLGSVASACRQGTPARGHLNSRPSLCRSCGGRGVQ